MQIVLKAEFDAERIIEELTQRGGTSFPLLDERTRQYLTNAALAYSYTKREMVVGKFKVRQDLSGTEITSSESPFFVLRDMWQSLLLEKINQHMKNRPLFTTPLSFNELSLQRYEVGSQGITPHLDQQSCINLICIIVLCGNCRFCVCKDREGDDPFQLDAQPGNAILLRAPGFLGEDYRPFHFLTDIVGPRISFGMRQHTHPPETPYAP